MIRTTHRADSDQLIEVMNVDVDEDAKQSCQYLLANALVVLRERNACRYITTDDESRNDKKLRELELLVNVSLQIKIYLLCPSFTSRNLAISTTSIHFKLLFNLQKAQLRYFLG